MELPERYKGKLNSQVLETSWDTHYQFSTPSVENSTLRVVVPIRRSTSFAAEMSEKRPTNWSIPTS